ncbi:MAG TPA: beta-galactosidase [Propionicimonas sp.]|nr:beta-galactosidase [Propionicimonas sp.]
MSLDRIGFGAAYYHEYHLSPRLETDLDLMVAGGLNLIRVGESVWSTWEPTEGEFNLDWLAPVLDAALARGIDVVIGTPTYAVPPWLRKAYPETALHVATGAPKPYGMRQDVNYAHPTFRRLAERVIRAIVGRYADHPAVVGWQVDNEPGLSLIYNPDVFAGFVDWCRKRYGTVDELNLRWGLTYWSHRLADWDELWTPEGNSTPSYDLAWRRYQAEVSHDYIGWQAELVRSLVPSHHWITTCIASNQPGQDVTVIGEPLDVAGANIYYASQDGLALPGVDDLDPLGAPFWIPWSGPAYVQYLADVARGMKQAPFLVTETNATSIGGSADGVVPWPGQRRQVVWQLLARGAQLIEYWHWHTNRYGAETWWQGILPHSLQPGRTYAELAEVGAELATNASLLTGLEPLSQVGLVVSAEARWGVEAQPPFHGPVKSWTGDQLAYEKSLGLLYRGLFDAGLACDIVSPIQLRDACADDAAELVRRWPVLVAVSLYVIDDADLDLLHRYVEAGGHLVWTPRSGMADEEAVLRAEVMPGALRPSAGAWYDESHTLPEPVPVTGLGGHALWYADCLVPDGAEVLAGYEHPFLGDYAAVTTRAVGEGRLTMLGCFPDRTLAGALSRWVATTSLPTDPWAAACGPTQSHLACRTADGQVLHILHNWSWTPSTYLAPDGRTLSLGPWDVQWLLDPATPAEPDEAPTVAELDEALTTLRQAQGALPGRGTVAELVEALTTLRQAQGALPGRGTVAEPDEALTTLRQAQGALPGQGTVAEPDEAPSDLKAGNL